MLSSLLAYVLMGQGAVGDPAPRTKVERCLAAHANAPLDYDAVRCLIILRNSVPPAQLRRAFKSLKANTPTASIYLGLLALKLDESQHSHAERISKLQTLLAKAKAHKLDGAQVVLLRHLLFAGRDHPVPGQDQAYRRELEELALRSTQAEARLHARAQLVLDEHRGVTNYAELATSLQIDPKQESTFGYTSRRALLLARAHSHRNAGDLEAALREYRTLETLAQQEQDGSTLAQVTLDQALVTQDRWWQDPEAQAAQASARAYARAAKLAKRHRRFTFQAQALAMYARLSHAFGDDPKRVEELVTNCFAAAKDARWDSQSAQCHTVQSQVLGERDPKRALDHALKALELSNPQDQLALRLEVWQQVIWRLWGWAKTPEDQEVAKRLHDLLLDISEEVRSAQLEEKNRMRVFSRWTLDYYWILHKRLAAPNVQDLEQALMYGERLRSRSLEQVFPEHPGTSEDEASAAAKLEAAKPLLLPYLRAIIQGDPDVTSRKDLALQGQTLSARLQKLRSPQPASPVTLAKLQTALDADEALLLFHAPPEFSYEGEALGGLSVIVVTRHHQQALWLSGTRSEIAALALRQRRASRDDPAALAAVNARLQKVLLVEQIEAQLPAGVTRLVLALDGPLHGISFAPLFGGRTVSRTPSAGFLLRTRARPSQPGALLPVAVVDPMLLPHPGFEVDKPKTPRPRGRLLRSSLEAEAIREHLSDKISVLSGQEASVANLQARWRPSRGLLHLATHTLVDREHHERSYVAMSPSRVAASEKEGQLGHAQIREMDFRNSLVVLSGCSTGDGPVTAGEGVISLATSFMRAGASAVVASLWDVRDDETAPLFQHFYACLGEGVAVDTCLRAARDAGRAQGLSAETTDAFFVIGDAHMSWPQTRARGSWLAAQVRWLAWLLPPLLALGWILGRRWMRVPRARS